MEKTAHKADAGDVIVIAGPASAKPSEPPRFSRCWGTSPTKRFRVRWEDGHERAPAKRRDDQAGGPPARVEQVEALTAQASEVRSPP